MALSWFILFAGVWAMGNGMLHIFFVLQKGLPYERELIRLLMDGYILAFGGILYGLAFAALRHQNQLGYYLGITAAIFLLGYCILIFKLLPAVGMILVNFAVLLWITVRIYRMQAPWN